MPDRPVAVQALPDAYAALGVTADASQAELKAAHRRAVRRWHPDLAAAPDREAATRRVQEVNVAYGLVRDAAARARYDAARSAPPAPVRAAARTRSTTAVRSRGEVDALLVAAGRWAGRWWSRHGDQVLRAGLRARRAGLDAVGRVLWLVTCAVAVVGFGIGAVAFQRVAGVGGVVPPLTGVIAGALVGNSIGWRRRLRLVGLPEPGGPGRYALVLGVAAVATAVGASALLGA